MRALWVVVLAGAVILALPAIVVGGLWIALILIIGWALLVIGSRLGIDILKERQTGVGAVKKQGKQTRGQADGDAAESAWRRS